MTVAEMIKELSKYDSNMKVYVLDFSGCGVESEYISTESRDVFLGYSRDGKPLYETEEVLQIF